MRSRRVLLGIISVVTAVVTDPVFAEEPQTELAAAEALFNRGLEDMRAGRFESACPLIAEAQRISPTPGTLYTLAECESRINKIATAVMHYREFLRLYDGMTSDVKRKQETRAKNAEAQITALEPEVPSLILVLPQDAPSGIEVTRDGIRLGLASIGIEVRMDPGEHVLVTRVPTGEKAEQRIVLEKRDKKTLELKVPVVVALAKPEPVKPMNVEEVPQRPWQKPMGIAGMALGGVGVGVGAALGGMALGKKNESNSNGHCDSQDFCDNMGLDLRKQAVTLAAGSDAALIVGGVLLAGGIVLFATAPHAAKQERGATGQTLNVQLNAGLSGAWVKGTW